MTNFSGAICKRCAGQRYEIVYRGCGLYKGHTEERFARLCGACGGTGRIEVEQKMKAAKDD